MAQGLGASDAYHGDRMIPLRCLARFQNKSLQWGRCLFLGSFPCLDLASISVRTGLHQKNMTYKHTKTVYTCDISWRDSDDEVTLESLFEEHPAEQLHAVKIDVEGSEERPRLRF